MFLFWLRRRMKKKMISSTPALKSCKDLRGSECTKEGAEKQEEGSGLPPPALPHPQHQEAFQSTPIDTILLDQNATELAKISKEINERLLKILTQDCCFWNLAYILEKSWSIKKKRHRWEKCKTHWSDCYQHCLQNYYYCTSAAILESVNLCHLKS